jgi:hypothetical protein
LTLANQTFYDIVLGFVVGILAVASPVIGFPSLTQQPAKHLYSSSAFILLARKHKSADGSLTYRFQETATGAFQH